MRLVYCSARICSNANLPEFELVSAQMGNFCSVRVGRRTIDREILQPSPRADSFEPATLFNGLSDRMPRLTVFQDFRVINDNVSIDNNLGNPRRWQAIAISLIAGVVSNVLRVEDGNVRESALLNTASFFLRLEFGLTQMFSTPVIQLLQRVHQR